MSDIRSRSLWLENYPGSLDPRPPLPGDINVDVAIIGGGYTGLWTAYYLTKADPSLRIAIIERDIVGFGASGRNGGWCIGEMAGGYDALRRAGDHAEAVAQLRAAMQSVDEVGRVVSTEGIDCDFVKGGTVRLARNGAQLTRQRAEIAHDHELGFTEADLRLLDATEAAQRVGATDVLGAIYFAHTARIHPAKLVRGLAHSVEEAGVVIYEQTAATDIEPRTVRTAHGTVRATSIVRATEGYTRSLPGLKRQLVPLYSLMVATEPLPADLWDEIGLRHYETFSDDRHLVIYGQRTADDRLAFGGRGAPYGFGSRVDSAIESRSAVHDLVASTLVELFPALHSTAITHRWGGVLGVPRDWFPSVGFDPTSGLAAAGGYVGEGVAIANLAGRTLADLLTDQSTDLTRLPWVHHTSRRWEPEPLRWLGINGALHMMERADRSENRTQKPSRTAAALNRLLR